MSDKTFCIKSMMDAKVFSDFAKFNSFRLNNRWLSMAMFPVIMTVFAVVNLITGSDILFWLFLAFGVVLPVLYIIYFNITVKNQIRVNRLETPRPVYTVTLSSHCVHIQNGSETTDVAWEKLYRVYRTEHYIYIYALKNRAFILPVDEMSPDDRNGAWTLCEKCVRKGRAVCLVPRSLKNQRVSGSIKQDH